MELFEWFVLAALATSSVLQALMIRRLQRETRVLTRMFFARLDPPRP